MLIVFLDFRGIMEYDGSFSGAEWLEKRALIIGRAYPEPSRKHIETVCTGALTEDGELIRLYPVSLRYLEHNQQYKLWTWVRFEAQKSTDDKRKESHRIREDSIEVLSNVESNAERFSLLQKALAPDRERLEVLYHSDWTSLGIVAVELTKVAVKEVKAGPLQLQKRLDMEILPLDGFPVDLRVSYRCRGNPDCKGHESSIIVWEYAEAFRQFRTRYGDNADARLKEVIEERYVSKERDTYALLGTHSRYPVWMIGQLYSFEKDLPPMLF